MASQVETEIDDKIDCPPCLLGVILGTGQNLCKMTQDADGVNQCNELYDKAVMGNIKVNDFVRGVTDIVKNDPDASFTMIELQRLLRERGLDNI